MSWGSGAWGLSGWGVGEEVPPPSVMSVSTPESVTGKLSSIGGTVMIILGDNFIAPVTVELLIGGEGSYEKVADCYVAKPIERYEVSLNRIYAGGPALPAGGLLDTDAVTGTRYHVRVTTAGGSAVLENAVFYRLFAEEVKIGMARAAWAKVWRVGRRFLAGY